MTIRFDPFLHPAIILGTVTILILLILIKYRRYQTVVSSSYWRLLLCVKILSLALLTILLLNPYIIQKTPDKDKVNIVFLVDATGSMITKDAQMKSRIERVKDDILNHSSLFYRQLLSKYDSAHYFLFSGEELRRFQPGNEFDLLPGETDIDLILDKVLTQPIDQNTLGAVVLISDGIDNKGVSLMAAAKKYKTKGIPIHCIGVGDPYPRSDIGIKWIDVLDESTKNEKMTLSAMVTRENSKEETVRVHLFEDNRLIETQDISFEEKANERHVKFEYTPFTAGLKTYKIQLDPLENEDNQLNNIDFAGIRIKDPDVFHALYFSANLGWDYKFLNIWADAEEKLTLDGVIRLSEQSYFVRGIKNEGKKLKGLPLCSILTEYDCLIINVNSLYLLSSDDISCLMNFVENKGGGILFTGLTNEFPQELLSILPIKELPVDTIKLDKSELAFRPSKVFVSEDGDEAAQLANALFLPEGAEIYRIEPSNIKPGAVEAVSMVGASWINLAVQHYGSGKTAYLNLPDTWKWVMELDEGEYHFGLFWGRLISWISSASKDRLTVQPASTKLTLSREQEFFLDVLDEQYNPDNGAKVQCTVISPGGEEMTMSFIPDPKVDGRYKAKFIPRATGDYRFYYKVKPGKGKVIDTTSDYLVIDASPESEPRPMAEGQLQSLARQTGGSYWNYQKINSIRDLTLTSKLNFLEEKRGLTEYWWFFAIALSAVIPDWIFRRRIGLR